jgi:hypothetical protein
VEAFYLPCGAGGPQLKRNPLGSAMTPLLVPTIAILLGTLAVLAIWRVTHSLDRLIHREFRERASEDIHKMAVPHDTALAFRFYRNATGHLARLDRIIKRLAMKAQRGDADAQAALLVLQQSRKDLVSDIEWSQQFLPSKHGAA